MITVVSQILIYFNHVLKFCILCQKFCLFHWCY